MEEEAAKPAARHRKRTKKLLNQIQKQLEFYFSDANLRHDRFLRKEIADDVDDFVSLSTMLKFNKLKLLTSDVCVVAKAVENSACLKLNEDRTKLKRIIQLPAVKNTDPHTIYVEQLPAYADHEWLKQVFSSCGTVDYVSLPRYAHDNKIKGFAFIEFSTPQEADKACQMLNTAAPYKNKNKKRHSSEAKSIDESLTKKRKRRRSTSFSGIAADNEKCEQNIEGNKKRKRARSTSESGTSPQKHKTCDISEDKTEPNKRNKRKLNANKEFDKTVDTTSEKCDEILDPTSKKQKIDKELNSAQLKEDDVKEKSSKKNRKHKKKKDVEANEISVPPLYVISKLDWLSLKKQYKNLQRKEMSELKKTMRILKSEKVRRKELKEKIIASTQGACNSNIEKEHVNNTDDEARTNNKNIELDCGKENVKCEQGKLENNNGHLMKESKNLEISSGTVVAMTSCDEKLCKKDIKDVLSQYDVAYVDYVDGSNQGHVRFHTNDTADKALCAGTSASWKFNLSKLSDIEEKEYFKKAEEDRQKKYLLTNRKKKRQKERGIEKITNEVNKMTDHIYFDDNK